MAERWKRPDINQLVSAYLHLFRSSTPLSKLKDAAFCGKLFDISTGDVCVPGRGMAWKLFLTPVPPLTPPASLVTAKPPIEALQMRRNDYVDLLLEKMRMPDGSYEEGFSVPTLHDIPRASAESASNLQKNNPLSLHEDNPWNDWFASVDLRRTIRQDVERTFPDIEYFRDSDVQTQLTYILYAHSLSNPDIGYRQGMHELLAPIYLAVDLDSIQDDAEVDIEMKQYCSRNWVAADAWALFTVVMEGVSAWYEWREPTLPPLPSPLRNQFRHGPSDESPVLKPYVAPIVMACQRLQAEYLKSTDPILWQGMQKAGIEPQIYGIRWLRMLFTREFSLPDAMIIWDGLFSTDQPFELVPWVCVAMLIRIRNNLIPSDYSGQLQFLLRYPPPPITDPSTPHHTVLLLRQVFALFTSPNAGTGASIAIENRNLLNIPLDVPDSPPAPRRAGRPSDRSRSASNAEKQRLRSSDGKETPSRLGRSFQSQQIGLPEMITRGLLEKGESLGINKTVLNAVSEIRKNLPDLTSQFMRTPAAESPAYGSFPLVDERPPEEKPPWEPRTRFEMEREISGLRGLQKRLGEAVGFAVDALLQDEEGDRDEETIKRIKGKKREALESLAHVRDLLNGSTIEVDEERLLGEEEYRRRRRQQISSENQAPAAGPSNTANANNAVPVVLRAPEPVVAARTSLDQERELPVAPPSHPLVSLPRSPAVFRPSPESPPNKNATTLPRRNTPSTSSSFHAPWNYTRSNFSAPSLISPTLPRPPPPSSTIRKNTLDTPVSPAASDQTPRQTQKSADPLGVLP